MRWTEPDFTEISLNMEVTAYVRTEGEEPRVARIEEAREPSDRQRSAR